MAEHDTRIWLEIVAPGEPIGVARGRDGTTMIGTLPPGTTIERFDAPLGGWIATHPDHPPKLVTYFGIFDVSPGSLGHG